MKLFSRKALAAVATTVALTTAGLSAPAFAEEPTTDPSVTTQPGKENNPGNGDGNGGGNDDTTPPANNDSSSFLGSSSNDGESSSKDMDAKEIREWVGVFTAVIGALSAAFVFIQRLTN